MQPYIDHTLDEILNLAALHFKVREKSLRRTTTFLRR